MEAGQIADTGALQASTDRATGEHTRIFGEIQLDARLRAFAAKNNQAPGSYTCLVVGEFASDFMGARLGEHLYEHGWRELQAANWVVDVERINNCRRSRLLIMRLAGPEGWNE